MKKKKKVNIYENHLYKREEKKERKRNTRLSD